MKISTEHKFLFSQVGAKRWLTRQRLPRTNALFPRTYSGAVHKGARDSSKFVYSLDDDLLRTTEALAQRLTDEFPMDVNDTGFAGESAVPGHFYNLLNVSGYGADPLPIPVINNASFVKSLGLVDKIRPEDLPWFQELVRLFFGHVTPANLHIRKKASSGFPYFTSDIQYRKEGTLVALKRADDYLAAMTGDAAQLRRGLEEYHSLHIYSINERQQPNAISKDENGKFSSKPRQAPTEAEARAGNFSGSTIADMSVIGDHGNVLDSHFAMRRRTVFGYSGIPNYFMTAIVGCAREVYLNRFEFTYKTRDRADKERKISPFKYVVGSDVKSMDTTVPEWFFRALLAELPKYWDERLVEMLRRMLFAPYVVPPPYRDTPDDYNPVFGGSPLDPDAFESHPGLPSGVFINPDLGKLWMSFVYIILYKDVGALFSVDELEPFLQGRHQQHALLDSSDDAAMLTNDPKVAAGFRAAVSPYAVLEPETPVLYLGDVFCTVGGVKRAFPNPVTFAVNAFCREDSIDRLDPISYAEGVLARHQIYSATPIFRDLNAIINEEMRKYTGINPYLIAAQVAKHSRWSDVDAQVKANPAYLHYRIDPNDVSQEVLDEIVATIPAADFFDAIRHLFKVPTISLEDV